MLMLHHTGAVLQDSRYLAFTFSGFLRVHYVISILENKPSLLWWIKYRDLT